MKGFLLERLALGLVDFFSAVEGLPAAFGLVTGLLAETGVARVDEGLATFLLTDFFVAADFLVATFAAGVVRTSPFLAAAVLLVTLLATFFAGVFLPTGFFTAVLTFTVAFVAFLAGAFLATDFFATGFFAMDFCAVAFLLVVNFFVEDFFTGFVPTAFAAGDFFVTALFAAFAPAALTAGFLPGAFFTAVFFFAPVVVFLLVFFVAMMSPRIRMRRRSVLDALPERMTARIVHWYAWPSVMTRWRWTCAERAARNAQVSVGNEGGE